MPTEMTTGPEPGPSGYTPYPYPPMVGEAGADPYTTEARLCDDRGLISDEPVDMVSAAPGLTYRRLLNNLRSHTGLPPYDGAPVVCTGSAHLAREHIRCTSPAHVTTSNTLLARASAPSSVTVVTAAPLPTRYEVLHVAIGSDMWAAADIEDALTRLHAAGLLPWREET